MPLPYPLPPAWKMQPALTRRWPALIWAAIAVALGATAIGANVAGDFGSGILQGALAGAVGAGVGVSYQRSGGERGVPLLLNAVVLSRARVRPPDSWIHFFHEAGPSKWLTAWFLCAGLVSSLSLGWSAVLVVNVGMAGLLWLVIPLLLGALILVFTGVVGLVQVVRNSTFSHRHVGLSLGRHGLIRYYLDDVDVWPWESIKRVKATGKTIDPTDGDFTAKIELVPTERPQDVLYDNYEITGYKSHAWLIYTAVRFWAEHPELREELGTTYAQRRIEGWRDEMVATTADSPQPS